MEAEDKQSSYKDGLNYKTLFKVERFKAHVPKNQFIQNLGNDPFILSVLFKRFLKKSVCVCTCGNQKRVFREIS